MNGAMLRVEALKGFRPAKPFGQGGYPGELGFEYHLSGLQLEYFKNSVIHCETLC